MKKLKKVILCVEMCKGFMNWELYEIFFMGILGFCDFSYYLQYWDTSIYTMCFQ